MNIIKTLILTLIVITMAEVGVSQTKRSVNDAQGLAVGTDAPMFKALDADSTVFSLKQTIKNGPVVLIFYRGFWCPVCNKHLGKIQDSLKLIEEAGAKVVAISPEQPEYLNKMAKKTKAEFTLLYDENYKVAEAYDVDFSPTKTELFTYNVILGGKLKKTHSDESQRLPIPATYIIDEQGKIIWRQFDHDYKKRSSVKDILTALQDR